jgi:4-hydroxyphenylacetate 3-monooxygenase
MFADEIWIGNLQPILDNQDGEAITCVVRCNAPGLQIWSRKAFATSAINEFDSPLTWRFDEGDANLVFENVKIDWNHVFVHRDPIRSSEIYIRTPAHSLANHQSSVRSLSKVRLLVGLAYQIACTTGAERVPAVRELLGRLGALEATLAGLVDAQVYRCDGWPKGGVSPNRRYVYAALNWCQECLPVFIDTLRDLSGAGAFRFPASVDVLNDPDVRTIFSQFWGTRNRSALLQMQLLRLGWDLIGSEFSGRQQQYERFYAGPPFVVRGHSYRETSWSDLSAIVTRLMALCEVPAGAEISRETNGARPVDS